MFSTTAEVKQTLCLWREVYCCTEEREKDTDEKRRGEVAQCHEYVDL